MTWHAPEFAYRGRGVSWYWVTIIIAAVMVAFAVWQRDFLFGLFVIVAEILAIVWATRIPRMISFAVTEREFLIGERRRYAMTEFESFSVDEDEFTGDFTDHGDFVALIFHFKGKLRAPLRVMLPAVYLDSARKNFTTVLRELPYEPTLIDSLEKIIGF